MKFVAIFLGPIVLLGCLSVVSAENKTLTNLIMGVFDDDGSGSINSEAEVKAFKDTFTGLAIPADNVASYYFVLNGLESKTFKVSEDQQIYMTWANRIGEAYDKDNNHRIDGDEKKAFQTEFNLTNVQMETIDANPTDGGITKMELLAALTSKIFVIPANMMTAGNVMSKYDGDWDGKINGSTEFSKFGQALKLKPLELLGGFNSMDDIKITVDEINKVIQTGPTITANVNILAN